MNTQSYYQWAAATLDALFKRGDLRLTRAEIDRVKKASVHIDPSFEGDSTTDKP